ncbi:MAG TPA: glycosyltransferase [Flavisolibacter sp.]|nr:glycosyltransferase [Flavisolibacter sp.]
MIFPLQVALTRLLLGRKVRIIVQHHGELPGKGLKKQAAKIADVFVNAYFFTAAENAFPWKVAGIIPARKKCFEILEASTYLQGKDPASSKKLLGFTAKHNFLWVGRLNSNKDPLTVLKGFHQFSKVCTDVTLYMIYQTEELLSQIQNFVDSTPSLKKKVVLVGKIPHDQMETWFSAANYYLSASRKEGSGYALLEAMACGCVPIISAIPPFRKITMNGKYGFLFEPGNEGSLLDAMFTAISHNSKEYIGAITHHFRSRLSFQAIASSMLEAFQELASKSALNESAAASIK